MRCAPGPRPWRTPQVAVTVALTWMTAVIAGLAGVGGNGPNRTLRMTPGPSPELHLLGATFDTWPLWAGLLAFIVADSGVMRFVYDIVESWKMNHVMNPLARVRQMRVWEYALVTAGFKLYLSFDYVINMFLTFSQVDVLAVMLLSDVAVAALNTVMAARAKLPPDAPAARGLEIEGAPMDAASPESLELVPLARADPPERPDAGAELRALERDLERAEELAREALRRVDAAREALRRLCEAGTSPEERPVVPAGEERLNKGFRPLTELE
jgi:hypothetical protein